MELPLRIDEILEACNGRLIQGNRDELIAEVSTDTRSLKGGELFVALRGQNFDGHDFINEAYQKGAVGAVIAKPLESSIKNLILVNDTLEALGNIAAAYRARFNIPMVAITGSNGKTTTKDMTASVLSQKFKVLKSESSLNNRIGIPMTLLELGREHEVGVLELGTSLWGEIPALAKIVKPEIGVIANIGPTHLEGLRSVERIAEEKVAILNFAERAILNFDDPLVSKMKTRFRGKVIGFGMSELAQIRAKHLNLDKDGKVDFELLVNGLEYGRIYLPCLGIHNVYNALAAAAVGLICGVNWEQIKSGLESYEPPKMRMQSEDLGGVRFINDAYNANPVSMKAAIEFLSRIKADGKKVAVLGNMLELGENSEQFHRNVGEFFSKSRIDSLVCIGREASQIALAAVENGFPKDSTFVCDSTAQAASYLLELLKPGDVVLIKGSRGMKLEEVVEGFKRQCSYT